MLLNAIKSSIASVLQKTEETFFRHEGRSNTRSGWRGLIRPMRLRARTLQTTIVDQITSRPCGTKRNSNKAGVFTSLSIFWVVGSKHCFKASGACCPNWLLFVLNLLNSYKYQHCNLIIMTATFDKYSKLCAEWVDILIMKKNMYLGNGIIWV